MTTPETLNELADRVEREEPTFALEADIFEEVGGVRWETALRNVKALSPRGSSSEVVRLGARKKAPPVLNSLRDAIRLAPWTIAHLSEIGGDGLPMCALTNGAREAKGYCFRSPTSGESALARALTAAALRARAADMQARAVGAPHTSRTA